MTKKIAIIGTVGLPAKYGGFETLAAHLVEHMGEEFDLTVYCTKKKYEPGTRQSTYGRARLVWLPFDANGIWSIPYDCLSILHALFYADVLLILGVSGGFLLPLVRWFTRKKIIVSIDGIEWKREKWSRPAKWYLWCAEKIAVEYSHADIADNESIQDYTAYRYGTLSNIIEYGADHTRKISSTAEDKIQWPFLSNPYAFNVCRIEPENNIRMMLEAFAGTKRFPLVMVGNWSNSEYGRALRTEFGVHTNMILLDPIYDQDKLDLLRGNAIVYVHGHSAGGTNPSLVEAMYLGLPIFAFNVSYNKTTSENKALYFASAAELSTLVNQTSQRELLFLAQRMSEIAHRRYTWKVIASKYTQLARQVLAVKGKIDVRPDTGNIRTQELLQMEMGHLANPAYFYEKR